MQVYFQTKTHVSFDAYPYGMDKEIYNMEKKETWQNLSNWRHWKERRLLDTDDGFDALLIHHIIVANPLRVVLFVLNDVIKEVVSHPSLSNQIRGSNYEEALGGLFS